MSSGNEFGFRKVMEPEPKINIREAHSEEVRQFCKENDITGEDIPFLEKGMAQKVDQAIRWIQANFTEISSTMYPQIKDPKQCKYFEDWVGKYEELRPGTARAFMFAWCEVFGGV